MKRILSTVAAGSFLLFVLLLLVAVVAFPMHIGEPSYYHVARIDFLIASVCCGFVSFSAFVWRLSI